jgi:hypothetical protein
LKAKNVGLKVLLFLDKAPRNQQDHGLAHPSIKFVSAPKTAHHSCSRSTTESSLTVKSCTFHTILDASKKNVSVMEGSNICSTTDCMINVQKPVTLNRCWKKLMTSEDSPTSRTK